MARRKHRPLEDQPVPRRNGSRVVAHCPRGITNAAAEELINSADRLEVFLPPIEASGRDPGILYVLHDGVLYRAEPTRRGISYHGFPEMKAKFDELTGKERRVVEAWADKLGRRTEFDAWLKTTADWTQT